MPPAAKSPTPEERHIRIEALKPAWLRDYIRDLEKINVALYQQVQRMQGQMEAQHLAPDAEVTWQAQDGTFTIRARTGGLIVEGDGSLIIRPAAPNEIIIARG